MSGPAADAREIDDAPVRAEPAAGVRDFLDANENALGPSPLAVAAMTRAIAEAHCYPDNGSKILRAELASRCGVEPAQIFCGAGSNEIIRLAAEVFVGPGQHALAPQVVAILEVALHPVAHARQRPGELQHLVELLEKTVVQ